MKISVVIPAYNEEKYLENCLKSLTTQTEKPFEIIVVDNNCTDKTVDIAKKYGARVLSEKKQGMINARNTGYNAVQGDIIARTDADTIVDSDWIERINKDFTTNKIDGLAGIVRVYDMPYLPSFLSIWFLVSMKLIAGGRELMIGPNMAISKTVWDKIKNTVSMDDKIVHEDFDIALIIHKIGGKILRDNKLHSSMSGRRIKGDPGSFFLEYPIRSLRTIARYS